MPKKYKDFPDQVNVLTKGGTLDLLRAIAYYRGEAGAYAGPARGFIDQGIREWIESLTGSERKRFESILETVRQKEAVVHNLN